MTRELNVKITLSERSNFQKLDDVDYADIIEAAIHEYTTNYQVCVEVLTVTPESANPKEGECKCIEEEPSDKCKYPKGLCPWSANFRESKCKYYEPKTEKK